MTVNRIICPRCTVQNAGWLIRENGYTHCVMCGYVLEDETRIGVRLIDVVKKGVAFQKQQAVLKRLKGTKIE